jgi:release factor glutamine methyltransferase
MEIFTAQGPVESARVLDICCGSGYQGIAAALRGHRVIATDKQPEAIVATRRNAWLSGVEIEAIQGDLFESVPGHRFDVILANPPYVPTPVDGDHAAWCDGGVDGRSVIDRICAEAASMLRDDGSLWIVHSSLAGIPATIDALEKNGLETRIAALKQVPLGPVSSARAEHLIELGQIENVADLETLAVIEARRDV